MPAFDRVGRTTVPSGARGTSIKQIARLAGVSHSTVSRALQGSPQVSASTTARIRKIAEEAGYRVSALARSLVSGRTHTIGVAVTNIADPFVSGVVRGIEDMADRHGYSVFLSNSNGEPDREVRVVRAFEERRVDGIIVTSSRVGELYVPLMERMGVPIVLLNNQHPSQFAHSVLIDNIGGSLAATRHLVELGHRRIAYIGDRFGYQSDTERASGFRRGLEEASIEIPPEYMVQGDGKPEGGQESMSALIALRRRPTAVFCYNDMSALGAMRQIHAAGLRVPASISVCGFDDLYISQFLEPPLTTVRQPMRQMGRMAMETLLHLFEDPEATLNLRVEGQLVVRDSTAPPKENR